MPKLYEVVLQFSVVVDASNEDEASHKVDDVDYIRELMKHCDELTTVDVKWIEGGELPMDYNPFRDPKHMLKMPTSDEPDEAEAWLGFPYE